MSEIRSIAEGTFVLGDTSNLTFEAGPGIQVSQPSEGTVRIANDETVLFESSNVGVTSFTTSEAIENFSEIWFYVKGGESTNIPVAKAILPMGFTDYSENLAICYGAPYGITGNIAITWTTRFSRSGNTFTFTSSYYGGAFGTTPNAGSNKNIGWVYKVVGINRISGGNNE